MRQSFLIACLVFALIAVPVQPAALAQAEDTIVPDLTGMNVPQAAAVLNRIGLALGSEVPVPPAGAPEDLISGQSTPPGTRVPFGSTIDVEIPRTPNVRLVYDDNDLTLVNLNDSDLTLSGIRFETVEGSNGSFNAERWSGMLRPRQCTQLWSISRNGPKQLPECRFIQNWLTTGNAGDHFWTSTSGARSFRVVQDDTERAVCPAAPPNSQDSPSECRFYVPTGGRSDVTAYIYMAYETNRLAVLNNSADRWMPVNSVRVANRAPDPGPFGAEFRINAALFGRPDIVARVNRLAPKQCLLFTADGTVDPPQPCDVIAVYAVEPEHRWWMSEFDIVGDNGARTCAGATAGKLTICVMPR
jgi:hypothetical protein